MLQLIYCQQNNIFILSHICIQLIRLTDLEIYKIYTRQPISYNNQHIIVYKIYTRQPIYFYNQHIIVISKAQYFSVTNIIYNIIIF